MRTLTAAVLVFGLTAGAAAAQTTSHSATTHSNASSANSSSNAMTGEVRGNAAVKDPTVKTGMASTAGANSFTEGQARDRIGKAGYTKVGALTKNDAGQWTGKGMKGGKSRTVMLDFKGAVTAK